MLLAKLIGESRQFRRGLTVGFGVEDEGSEVAVEPRQVEPIPTDETTDRVPGLAVLQVESEATPVGDAVGGEVDADGDPGSDVVALGNFLGHGQLVAFDRKSLSTSCDLLFRGLQLALELGKTLLHELALGGQGLDSRGVRAGPLVCLFALVAELLLEHP